MYIVNCVYINGQICCGRDAQFLRVMREGLY
jgi:tartrate dehydratase beta subunit/fumarate hydratase class I family protein